MGTDKCMLHIQCTQGSNLLLELITVSQLLLSVLLWCLYAEAACSHACSPLVPLAGKHGALALCIAFIHVADKWLCSFIKAALISWC